MLTLPVTLQKCNAYEQTQTVGFLFIRIFLEGYGLLYGCGKKRMLLDNGRSVILRLA